MIELIDVQDTALKNAKRFIASEFLTESPFTVNFVEDSFVHPILEAAWYIEGVKKLSLKDNILTIFLEGQPNWEQVERTVRRLFAAYQPPKKQVDEDWENKLSFNDKLLYKNVVAVLDEDIRPLLQADRGDITVERFSADEIHLVFQGACRGCGFSKTSTLQMIKEKLLVVIPTHQIFVS